MANIQKTTNLPLVSIIIPYYNCEDYIEETLQSIESQTYKNYEVILVNDGSTKESTMFIENLSKIRFNICYIYQINKGAAAARNAGAKLATGEYLLFLDADNKIHPEYLSKTVVALLSKPNCKLVYTKSEFFDAQIGERKLPEYKAFKDILIGNSIDMLALVRKSDFNQLQGFDENLKTHEDWDYWIRLLKDGGEVILLDEILFSYRKRHNKTSLTDNLIKNPTANKQSWQNIYIKHSDIYLENSMGFLDLIDTHKKQQKRFKWFKKLFFLSK